MLEDLDTIDWALLEHAHGEATDVPAMLRSLASPNADERMQTLAMLFEIIWHQGTVFPATAAAVPFLFELLTHPDVDDKGGIAVLISAITEGEGYYQVHAQTEEARQSADRWLVKRGTSVAEKLAEEAATLEAIHQAVSPHLRLLLPFLTDPAPDLRVQVAAALGCFPEHRGWLLPEIETAIEGESDDSVRKTLIESKSRLAASA